MNTNQDIPPVTPGRPEHKRKKKVYGLIAGAVLATAVAFGGNAAISTANVQAASIAATATLQQTTGTQTSQAAPKGNRGSAQRGAAGTISAISGDTLTLKQGDVVVIQATLNATTVYTKAGQTITKGDLKVGQMVSVRTTTASDGTVSVSQVEVILNHASGTISAVDATSLTLTKADNTTLKVSLDSATKYLDLGNSITLAELKTGVRVKVAGELDTAGILKAETVSVQHDRLSGTVSAINGSTLIIQLAGRDGKGANPAGGGTTSSTGSSTATPTPATTTAATTKTVTVSGSTVYLEGGQSVQLSSVTVGERIEAVGTLSSDGTSLSALQITVALPHYDGQVTSINGSTIVLQDRSGTSRTIEVTSNTRYLNGQASAALSDIQVGANIQVEGQVDASGKMTASVVQLGQAKGSPGKGGR